MTLSTTIYTGPNELQTNSHNNNKTCQACRWNYHFVVHISQNRISIFQSVKTYSLFIPINSLFITTRTISFTIECLRLLLTFRANFKTRPGANRPRPKTLHLCQKLSSKSYSYCSCLIEIILPMFRIIITTNSGKKNSSTQAGEIDSLAATNGVHACCTKP